MGENTTKNKILTLPNILTAIRILMVPAILVAFFNEPKDKRFVSLCFFLIAGITDCLDGYFARKTKCVTTLGMVLDPIADKLLTATMLFCLVKSKTINVILLIIIVFEELCMAVGAAICLRNKIKVSADIFGKSATVFFYAAVFLCWPWHGIEVLTKIGQGLVNVSVLLSIVAGLHYLTDAAKSYRQVQKK